MNRKMKKNIVFLAVIFSILISMVISAQEIRMKPFVVDWRDNPASLLDLSFLNEAPAGKDGFIKIKNAHFVKPDGERFLVWGVNVTAAACFPAKENAVLVAAKLAKSGVNCVRFHFLDSAGPDSLFDTNREDTRHLDPGQLNKLDFFVAELKKRGIYANFNLNVGRMFRRGDGVKDFEYLGLAKSLQYFDDTVLSRHKEFARQLLTHFNPYTQSEYRNEPALFTIELVNENSIVEAWKGGRLEGRNNTRHPSTYRDFKSWGASLGKLTWTDITPLYSARLMKKYNVWLKKRLSPEKMTELRRLAGVGVDEPIPRLMREEIKTAPPLRFGYEAEFYMTLEKDFFEGMSAYLKEDLGVKAAIVGSADHNHWVSGYPFLSSASRLDVVDGHVYWQAARPLTVEGSDQKRHGVQNTPWFKIPSIPPWSNSPGPPWPGSPSRFLKPTTPSPMNTAAKELEFWPPMRPFMTGTVYIFMLSVIGTRRNGNRKC